VFEVGEELDAEFDDVPGHAGDCPRDHKAFGRRSPGPD
jgi:hypothetical protein